MQPAIAFVTRVTDVIARIARALDWLPPTVARVVVGWVFFISGWGKLNDLQTVVNFFTELGIPAPGFQALLASSAELVCGGLLLVGFATRFAVVPLIITMCVAIRTALWEQVTDAISLFGLAEFLYITLLVWLGVSGAGPLSVDALMARLSGHIGAPAPVRGPVARAI
jgi:putative oxidoreductase